MLVELLVTVMRANDMGEPGDTVDLGCGTGLCGCRCCWPLSRTLYGVDLSPNMLDKARQRQVYDQLTCSELTAFLQHNVDRYDVALAADVFVYIGDLSPPCFMACVQHCGKTGYSPFSVEECDGARLCAALVVSLRPFRKLCGKDWRMHPASRWRRLRGGCCATMMVKRSWGFW